MHRSLLVLFEKRSLLVLFCFSSWSRCIIVSALQTYNTGYRSFGTLRDLRGIETVDVFTSVMHQNYRMASTHRASRIRHRYSFVGHMAMASGHNDDQGTLITTSFSPTKCSSRDAASIIQNSTAQDGLLVITCDASGRGGGSKHDGIAAILRIRHGTALLPNTTSQYRKGNEDLIDIAARRTVPSRTSSEVAAISLGIKRALSMIPPALRKQVLILTDSEFALDKFCSSEGVTEKIIRNTIPTVQRVGNQRKKRRKGTAALAKGKRKQTTQSMEHREEAHRRSLMTLLKETPKGVLFCKVRSSSRGISISNAGSTTYDDDEITNLWSGIGFIDHDAADHLSSMTRSVANTYNDDKKKKVDISAASIQELPFRIAKPLGDEDIAWLSNSDNDKPGDDTTTKSNDFFKCIEVVGPDARRDRLIRSQRRAEIIEELLGQDSLGLL